MANSKKSEQSATQDPQKSKGQQATPATPASSVTPVEKKGGKQVPQKKSTIGGTAVQGAKSTQPKEMPSTGKPADQQPEYYNREMRRRMQAMGTGPYAEKPSLDPRERKRKRQERIKARQEEIRQKIRARGPGKDVGNLGRNVAIFVGVTVAILVIALVVFLVLHHGF